jgi:hypothetical protein
LAAALSAGAAAALSLSAGAAAADFFAPLPARLPCPFFGGPLPSRRFRSNACRLRCCIADS